MTKKLHPVIFCVVWLAGCGGGKAAYGDTDYLQDPIAPGTGTGAATGTGSGTGTGAPAEDEDDLPGLLPAQSDRHVFIANSSRNTLTRVDAITREVRTIPVGARPISVLTTPDHRTAVVFNADDDTVSLVDVATLESRTVEVRDDLNTMLLSHDGAWVALFHDQSAEDPNDPGDGSQSFNEVSFVAISDGAHYPMAAGFNPHTVEFTEDGSTAVVVSDNALALVDLSQRPLLPEMLTISEELEPPVAEELVLTPDGTYGFLRQFGAAELLVVDIPGRGIEPVPVGENPTDLDVTPDGKRVVAVSRSAAQLWTYDLADPHAPGAVLDIPEGLPFGQVVFDPTGAQAVLFTNAVPLDVIGIWTLSTDTITLRQVVNPVQGVTVTPTGETAVIFHSDEELPDFDPDSPFAGQWVVSALDLVDGRYNPLLVPGEPIGFTHSASGTTGYFIFAAERYFDILDYRSLLFDELVLPSRPEFVGVLPDPAPADGDEPAAWASQSHELGRISFYDRDDGSLETVTGFELNGEIESEP